MIPKKKLLLEVQMYCVIYQMNSANQLVHVEGELNLIYH